MKQYLFLVSFLMLFSVSQAQKKAEKSAHKYAVTFPYLDIKKELPVIKKKISNIPGVSISGYCPAVKAVFFTSSDESYFNMLIALKETELVYYIRPGEKESAYCEELGEIAND